MLDEAGRTALRERAEQRMRDNPKRAAEVSRMLLEMAERVHKLALISDDDLLEATMEQLWGGLGMMSAQSDILSELMDRLRWSQEIAKSMALISGAESLHPMWDEMWKAKMDEIREAEGQALDRGEDPRKRPLSGT